MFGKVFEQMFTGSLYGKRSIVFAVFTYLIVHMRPGGDGFCYVEANPLVLAATFSESPEDILQALRILEAADEASRDPAEDGRRIVLVGNERGTGPRQYRVVNGSRFRGIKDEEERRLQNRDRKARERARKRAYHQVSAIVIDGNTAPTAVPRGHRASRTVAAGPRRSPQAEEEKEEEVEEEMQASTTVVAADEVKFLRDVVSTVVPHLTVSDREIAGWLTEFRDLAWIAAAICESERSLKAALTPGYVRGMLRTKAMEGWDCLAPLEYAIFRLSSVKKRRSVHDDRPDATERDER